MLPVFKGLVWGLGGWLLGALVVVLIRLVMGLNPWELEPAMLLGYPLGFVGWILGVGAWDTWIKGYFGRRVRPYEPEGWRRFLGFNTDHKVIGIQYGVTFVFLLLFAGLLAMGMRAELMSPGRDLFDFDRYNNLVSLHGLTMILVGITIIPGLFGNYTLPLMLGADDMAFPHLNALSYWMWPAVALLLITSPLVGGWDTGWTGYPPLALVNSTGQTFYALAFITAALSSTVASVNFIVTVIAKRAPGMDWGKMPIFVWSVFFTAILALLSVNFLGVGLVGVLLDRVAGTAFFNPDLGGNPVVYQHLFWFTNHPEVYIIALPGWGIMLEVLAHFSRKPLFAYRWAVGGMLGVSILSFTVWFHHMFTATSDRPEVFFMATTEAISVPTGLIFLSALGTIWRGRLWLTTPMLFALGGLFTFLIGGLTGVFNSDVPVDQNLHDTFWVVSHFHYTIIGSAIFGFFAGVYYWFPKITGRMYNEALGKLHFWVWFLAFQLVFAPMSWLGMMGQNRRVGDYDPALGGVNMFISVSAFVLASSVAVFVFNMAYSWVKGAIAERNPWRARTLEWITTSPPPKENFPRVPHVVGGPYDYGVPGSVHGVVPVAGASNGEQKQA